MANKRSYRDDIIRFTFLLTALGVFFVGPRYVTTDQTADIDDTIVFIQKSKMPSKWAGPVLAQLAQDKKFAQENADKVSIASVNLPIVYWLAVIILILGVFGPFLLKVYQNKKTADSGK